MIIAVDGPTASGKGTLAKALAAHFGLPFLDTGLLYRAVGRQVQMHNGNPDDPADALAGCDFPDSILDDAALRTEAVGGLASRVSLHPQVRAALNKRQVDFANQPGGALLDGRDIGTVIAPHADVKLFVGMANFEGVDAPMRKALNAVPTRLRLTPEQAMQQIKKLEQEMFRLARNLEFEKAATVRDEISRAMAAGVGSKSTS